MSFKNFAPVALAVAALAFGSAAQAAAVTSFTQIANDGVYSITADYAAALGLTGATHIGVIGIRTNTTPARYTVGDTFDAASLLNSTANDASILGFLNGISPSANYTGSAGDALGLTTIDDYERDSDRKLFNVAFFGFNTASNIVFNGTATFNAGQSLGDFGTLLPQGTGTVSAPGTLALVGLALTAGALVRRRAA